MAIYGSVALLTSLLLLLLVASPRVAGEIPYFEEYDDPSFIGTWDEGEPCLADINELIDHIIATEGDPFPEPFSFAPYACWGPLHS